MFTSDFNVLDAIENKLVSLFSNTVQDLSGKMKYGKVQTGQTKNNDQNKTLQTQISDEGVSVTCDRERTH